MGNTTIGGVVGGELNLAGNITENSAGLSLTKGGSNFIY